MGEHWLKSRGRRVCPPSFPGVGDLSGSCTSFHIVPSDTDAADLWDAAERTESLVDVELVYRMTT